MPLQDLTKFMSKWIKSSRRSDKFPTDLSSRAETGTNAIPIMRGGGASILRLFFRKAREKNAKAEDLDIGMVKQWSNLYS